MTGSERSRFEQTHYSGTRITVPTHIGKARLKIQIDIGLGDATIPTPSEVQVPSLLDLPGATMRAYAPETVVAEKLEALIVLGLHTSRMKDLYDLLHIKHQFALGDTLPPAIRATFERRGTPVPRSLPIGLTDAFAADEVKQTQWRAFLRKATDGERLDLKSVIAELRDWLWPILEAASE